MNPLCFPPFPTNIVAHFLFFFFPQLPYYLSCLLLFTLLFLAAMGEIQPQVVPQPLQSQVDDAVVYLKGHSNGAVDSQVDLRALRRKIDRRLIPYMFCCYILQFLDKVMLNVSVTFNPIV